MTTEIKIEGVSHLIEWHQSFGLLGSLVGKDQYGLSWEMSGTIIHNGVIVEELREGKE